MRQEDEAARKCTKKQSIKLEKNRESQQSDYDDDFVNFVMEPSRENIPVPNLPNQRLVDAAKSATDDYLASLEG